MKQALKDMMSLCPEWYAEEDSCYQNKLFATSILYTAKLHRHCSFETRADREGELGKRRANAANRNKKAAEKKASDNKFEKRPVEEEKQDLDEDQSRASRSDLKNSRKSRKLKIMKHM